MAIIAKRIERNLERILSIKFRTILVKNTMRIGEQLTAAHLTKELPLGLHSLSTTDHTRPTPMVRATSPSQRTCSPSLLPMVSPLISPSWVVLQGDFLRPLPHYFNSLDDPAGKRESISALWFRLCRQLHQVYDRVEIPPCM